MCFSLKMNTLVLEMNALKMHFRTSATHIQLHVATSECQTDLGSRWLLFTSTDLWNEQYHALILTSEYTLHVHPQVIYAIAFSAGLNGLQVDQVDRENNKQTTTYTQLVPSKLVAACNARVQLSGCGLTIHATTTQLLREKLRSIQRRTRSMLATVSRSSLASRISQEAKNQ